MYRTRIVQSAGRMTTSLLTSLLVLHGKRYKQNSTEPKRSKIIQLFKNYPLTLSTIGCNIRYKEKRRYQMTNYFRLDNTEGYTEEQIAELNRLANEQITEDMDAEEIQAIEEKILREF